MKKVLMMLVTVVALAGGECPALTRHVSFRPTEVGSSGSAVVAPVVSNRRAPQGSFVTPPTKQDEEKAKPKERVLKGRVVKVVAGDELWVMPAGGAKQVVKMIRIAAPKAGEPYFDESVDFLSGLVFGKTVEVRWRTKDKAGRVYGTVFLPHGSKGQMVELNLTAVTNGSARYAPLPDDPVAFAQAEKSARENKRGLWSRE